MAEQLVSFDVPRLWEGRLVLAFSGWMDGGDVSTGSVEWLVRAFDAEKVAEIAPENFYIYNFPGSMEVAQLFRPHARIEDGLIREYAPPTNAFHCDPTHKLALFCGKEPNFNWPAFAECIFNFTRQAGVATLYFIGSVAGTVPHTREPRFTSTVSDESLKSVLEPLGVKFTNYEGPASFITYLLTEATSRRIPMASLVAEIPAYIQGTNPKCIAAVARKLSALLELPLDLEPMHAVTEAWEKRLSEALEGEQELNEHIEKLEADYDNEVFDTQMGDLKAWLEQRGVRVD